MNHKKILSKKFWTPFFLLLLCFLQIAQPIRYALEYTGMEFEDRRYDIGAAPDFDKSSWTDEKYELGLDFPNVSMIIFGDFITKVR